MKKSKTLILIFSVVVVILLSTSAILLFKELKKPNVDFTYIKMSRSACYGSCPVYTIEINDQGEVTYTGTMYVGTKGEKRFEISNKQLEELDDVIKASDFFSLNDSYDGDITDLPSTTTQIRTKDREKSIYNYVGAPESLNQLEDKIDEITGAGELTNCDDNCQKNPF